MTLFWSELFYKYTVMTLFRHNTQPKCATITLFPHIPFFRHQRVRNTLTVLRLLQSLLQKPYQSEEEPRNIFSTSLSHHQRNTDNTDNESFFFSLTRKFDVLCNYQYSLPSSFLNNNHKQYISQTIFTLLQHKSFIVLIRQYLDRFD